MNKKHMIEYVESLGGIETPKGWNIPTNVFLNDQNLTEIPINFNIVEGNFSCANNKLTSLKGCPKVVKHDFYCFHNNLTSLKSCPKEVYGFYCSYNLLTSLKYCPKEVKGNFYCFNNQLTSYKHTSKEVKGNFYCDKGYFQGKGYYKFLLQEKVITESEYLLAVI